MSQPYRKHSGHIHFLSLVSGLVTQCCKYDELPAPQSVIGCVFSLSKVSGVSKNLVFANHNLIPFNWPNNDFPSLDPTPMGGYSNIPAKILGVLVDHSTMGVSHPVCPLVADVSVNNEPDWTTLAAMQNADLDMAAQLPPAPEIIELDDNNDDDDFGPFSLPSTLHCTLKYIPKVKPDLEPSTISSPLPSHASPVPPPRYPSHT
jgi:hypothetical protein